MEKKINKKRFQIVKLVVENLGFIEIDLIAFW